MKVVSLLLVSLLVWNGAAFADQAAPASGSIQVQTQETAKAAKIKAKVQKRGIGEKSRVRAKLVNGAEVKGYISKIEDATFDVTDKNTGQATTIPYADVEKLQGSGLSKGAKIGIIVGVAVVIVVVVIAAGLKSAGY